MRRDFTTRKRAILGLLIFLGVTDAALGVYSWRLASAPQALDREIAQRERNLNTLKGAIVRAREIKEGMPNAQRDCQKFESSLLPASSGYSSVSAELQSIAKKNGVRVQDLAFKPTPVRERGLTELVMDLTVEGDYKGVVQFLNGLQRSEGTYEMESLILAPGGGTQAPANMIKVGLHLKTYFRTAA